MKKLLVIAIIFVQVVTLVQIGTHFASAAAFTQCSDGINNDPLQDNLIDAADPGCHSDFNASNSSSYDSNLNSEINPTTGGGTTSYQCNDGTDNDNDGRTDMSDRDCTSTTDNSEFSSCLSGGCDNPCENDCNPQLPIYQCSDHLDNDNDGKTDYPADPGCFGPTDNDEYEATGSSGGGTDTTTNTNTNSNTNNNSNSNTNTIIINNGGSGSGSGSGSRLAQCDDDRDNDNDGDKDYPEDRGCSSRNDNSEDSERNGNNNGEGAPYFTSSPAGSAIVGQTYSYNADALSPNGRDILYSLAVSPSGMTINSFTGLVQWFVSSSLGNTYQAVLVVATDEEGDQATQSYIISVRGQVAAAVVYQSTGGSSSVRAAVSAPAQRLRVSDLDVRDVGGDVVVSFRTNVDATGSVRFGPESELEKTANFTYPASRRSISGRGTFHEVNLGPLAPSRTYYLRAFVSTPASSAFSPELMYVRTLSPVGAVATAEVAGADSCFDGLDNDLDGDVDGVDSDCETGPAGRVAGAVTFASTFGGLGSFLTSPWLLLLVIIILVVYIIANRRREAEMIHTHTPIEIRP